MNLPLRDFAPICKRSWDSRSSVDTSQRQGKDQGIKTGGSLGPEQAVIPLAFIAVDRSAQLSVGSESCSQQLADFVLSLPVVLS